MYYACLHYRSPIPKEITMKYDSMTIKERLEYTQQAIKILKNMRSDFELRCPNCGDLIVMCSKCGFLNCGLCEEHGNKYNVAIQ